MARTPTTTDAFNAVAEASRRDLLDAIGTGEVTVNELVERLGLSQPQVSKHLAVLRQVGVVLVRKDGRHRWYRVNGPVLQPIHDWVSSFERTWNTRLDRLDDLLAELTTEGATAMTATRNRHGSAVVTLPSDTEILITRQFDAPASAVFEALTTPELVKRWWGFDSSVWEVCDIDLRVGGSWRYVIKEGDTEVGFHGVYKEIDGATPASSPPRRSRGSPRSGCWTTPTTWRRSTPSRSTRSTASRRCRRSSATSPRSTATATSSPAWRAG